MWRSSNPKPKMINWDVVYVRPDIEQKWRQFEYTLIPFKLADGSSIEIAKQFLSDAGRLGNPDRFFINGEEIQAAKTEEEQQALIQKLLNIAGGDKELVKQWTLIWNHRCKLVFANEISERFVQEFQLKPIINRDSLTKVIVSLDTGESKLHFQMEGRIKYATDPDEEIKNVDVTFSARMCYEAKEDSLEENLEFVAFKIPVLVSDEGKS